MMNSPVLVPWIWFALESGDLPQTPCADAAVPSQPPGWWPAASQTPCAPCRYSAHDNDDDAAASDGDDDDEEDNDAADDADADADADGDS